MLGLEKVVTLHSTLKVRSFNKVAKYFTNIVLFNGHVNGLSRDHKSTATSCEKKIDLWHDRVNRRRKLRLQRM